MLPSPELFSDSARSWRQRLLDGQVGLVVPNLHFWEFANVLRTYARRAELQADLATEVYELHLHAPLEVKEPACTSVLQTSLRFDSTAYDAVYIALSQQLRCKLLTAERTTTPWVSKLGPMVLSIG